MEDTQQIQVTTDYGQFKFIDTNRDQARGHIEALKTAFGEMGNLTKVQPILVNDQMEIIDGQHRFMACKELGEAIYFTVVPGLNVRDARQMNLLHRTWAVEDFAKSYAKAGDVNYQEYLDLREDFPFAHSVILLYTFVGQDNKGIYKDFRNGDFVLEDKAAVAERLSLLDSTRPFVSFAKDKQFARAFLKAIQIEGYDHKRMLRKLELHQTMLRRYASVEDYLRMLEEIYNFQMQEGSRLRLY